MAKKEDNLSSAGTLYCSSAHNFQIFFITFTKHISTFCKLICVLQSNRSCAIKIYTSQTLINVKFVLGESSSFPSNAHVSIKHYDNTKEHPSLMHQVLDSRTT